VRSRVKRRDRSDMARLQRNRSLRHCILVSGSCGACGRVCGSRERLYRKITGHPLTGRFRVSCPLVCMDVAFTAPCAQRRAFGRRRWRSTCSADGWRPALAALRSSRPMGPRWCVAGVEGGGGGAAHFGHFLHSGPSRARQHCDPHIEAVLVNVRRCSFALHRPPRCCGLR
jgi:hypothetical protein